MTLTLVNAQESVELGQLRPRHGASEWADPIMKLLKP